MLKMFASGFGTGLPQSGNIRQSIAWYARAKRMRCIYVLYTQIRMIEN